MLDWETHVDWVRAGKTDIVSQARERVEALVAEHKPLPLPAEHQAAVSEILKEAREHYRATGDIRGDECATYIAALEAAGLA